MFSAFNPSKCTHAWSSGQPTLRRPGSSWGFDALVKGLTLVVDNSCRSRDSNPQPRVTSPTLYPLEPRLPLLLLLPRVCIVPHYGQLDMCRAPTPYPLYRCAMMWRISPEVSSLQPISDMKTKKYLVSQF